MVAAVWHPKPSAVEAARRVDQCNGHQRPIPYLMRPSTNRRVTYQSLVEADAQSQAHRVDPERVVTWNWHSRLGKILAMVAALWLAVTFLPQFDPFGKVAKAEEARQKSAQLEDDKKATELRKAELKEQGEASKSTEEVDKSINDLTKTFGQMKRDQPESNRKELNERQKDIGAKFRKFGSDKLRTLLSQNGLFQGFGGERQEKLRKWSDELLNGNSEELKAEMQSIQDELQKLYE